MSQPITQKGVTFKASHRFIHFGQTCQDGAGGQRDKGKSLEFLYLVKENDGLMFLL